MLTQNNNKNLEFSEIVVIFATSLKDNGRINNKRTKTIMDQVEQTIKGQNFEICHQYIKPGKDEQKVSYDDLGLCDASIMYLKKKDITLWSHQHESIKLAKNGRNICVTTSTSSGKTQIFQISAMEILHNTPGAKVLAIYPMKALGNQQVERWKDILEGTGLSVGKIDGNNTNLSDRIEQLKKDVLIITPDALHAFVLGNLNNQKCGKEIKAFLSMISLIIIDELHLYKGYFGTNAAYLFRRLNNVRRLLRKKNDFPQYITASATMPNAPLHSFNITGVKDFIEIGFEQDGSPARPKQFLFIESKETKIDRNDQIKSLVYALAKLDGTKSITFVDSRNKTGEMAVSEKDEENGIFPYRSGYEEKARETIEARLKDEGIFKGVISTSALEIGIDIDALNIVIIADMPYDKNSYQQRIGRVGRYGCVGDSYVIIVRDSNSFASNLLFTEYNYDMDKALPDYEPTLYLEDEQIQYIHALCHVGNTEECEYEEWKGTVNRQRIFDDGGCFPASFVQLCNDVITGNAPKLYYDKEEKSNCPHFENSLRFFGPQYQLYDLGNNNVKIDKPISRRQLSTEAYKGAIRNTVGTDGKVIKHRIKSLDLTSHSIFVRKEFNNYVKTSAYSRTFIIPNFKNGIIISLSCGSTGIYNMRLTEHINIWGYYEHKRYEKYENVFKLPPSYTTGTLFFHPSFNRSGVNCGFIAQVLFEALLRRNAFDRNDLNYYGGRLFTGNNEYATDTKFVALYDVADLNLTQSIVETSKLKDLFEYLSEDHLKLIIESIRPDMNDATRAALNEFCIDMVNHEIVVDDEVKEYKDFKLKDGTTVLYRQHSEDDPENEDIVKEIQAIFVGIGTEKNTINLFVKDKLVYGIDINDVLPIEGLTEYVEVN